VTTLYAKRGHRYYPVHDTEAFNGLPTAVGSSSSAEVERLGEEVARLDAALTAIAVAEPRWVGGVGSYSGGETWHGFARRLKQIAAAALAPPEGAGL
jgi:hypothetical protein